MGQGYWTRGNPEQCLLATRGRPQVKSHSVRKLIVEKRREHSRKPDTVRDRIEQLAEGPYLELFARETKTGWDNWGNQAGLFDDGPVETRRQSSGRVIPTQVADGHRSSTCKPDSPDSHERTVRRKPLLAQRDHTEN